MVEKEWMEELFATIDSLDSEAFAAYITPDGMFRWGSFPEMNGTEAIVKFVTGFFSMLTGLSHNIENIWQADGDSDIILVKGTITYTIPNGDKVTLNFLNQFLMQGKMIREYLIYADPTPLNEAFANQ